MLKNLLSLKIFLPLLAVLFMVSCDTDEFTESNEDLDQMLLDLRTLGSDEYTADLAEVDLGEETDEEMQRFRGKRPCFQIVFPVNLIYPDGEVVEMENRRAMRKALREWKQENQDAAVRPMMEFPIDVLKKDGTLMTIESLEGLKELMEDCHKNKPEFPRWKLCFEPVFPLNIAVPTSDVPVVVENHEALKALMKDWKENHPDADVRPSIIFPIEVTLYDNDGVYEVANMDELKELIKDCIEKLKEDRKKKGKWGKKGDKGK